MPLLEVTGISKRFGGLRALDDVTFSVEPGQIYSVIGPNGAGKTTLYNILTGFVPASGGNLKFKGVDITRASIHHRVRLGMARTFQNIRLFRDLTVLENVMVGQHTRANSGFRGVFSFLDRQARDLHDQAMELLDLAGIAALSTKRAGDLPYGKQKLVELARALAANPELLLLDEPRAGMNPAETDDISMEIQALSRRGITILLVEHDMRMVMGISDRVCVLNFGKKLVEGSPAEVRANDQVIEAYLGRDE